MGSAEEYNGKQFISGHSQPLIQLKPSDQGYEGAPLFITHGIGGTIMDCSPVVKHLRTPRAVHGIQARGLDGLDAPFDRIEEMAEYYLHSVRERQPRGPYFLTGYSLGGLIMFEMAQRLSAEREQIALLAMVDSYPHSRYLKLNQRIRLRTRLARRRAAALTNGVASRIVRSLGRRQYDAEGLHPTPPGRVLTPAMQRVRECEYSAWKRYKPRFYGGTIRFVQASVPTFFPSDPVSVWASLTKEFIVDTIPADHMGILTTHSKELADKLSLYVADTFFKTSGNE
jgi:acetoacetyl-CoA synthetase